MLEANMSDQFREFDTRLKRIDRRHRKIAQGYAATVGRDGLLVAVPRRRRLRVPFAGIALVAVGIIAFKGLVLAQLGAAGYETRVANLATGSQIEQAGAWVMQADPMTVWVAGKIAFLLQ
jgi:hypothetical protein